MRAKWQRSVERAFPRLTATNSNINQANHTRHTSDTHTRATTTPQYQTSAQRGGGRGGSSSRGSRGGARPPTNTAAGGFRNSNSRVNPRPANAGPVAKDTRGLETCHGYNGKNGCRRTPIDATTCRDQFSQTMYSHFCSNWDPASNSHCLGTHPRFGNH